MKTKKRQGQGKIPVLVILKRNCRVYTRIVKNCIRQQLIPIIKGKILENSTIYTDSWKGYDGLIVNGYGHYRIYYYNDEFTRGRNHINSIELF